MAVLVDDGTTDAVGTEATVSVAVGSAEVTASIAVDVGIVAVVLAIGVADGLTSACSTGAAVGAGVGTAVRSHPISSVPQAVSKNRTPRSATADKTDVR